MCSSRFFKATRRGAREETGLCDPVPRMWFVVLRLGDGVAQDTTVLAALEDALRLALELAHPLA